jgi:Cu-Zn family superoxide dismutase
VAGGVRVVLDARGLPPGPKGVHIHTTGKCDAPGFASAGGHFNPDGKKHGLLAPDGAHAGDLPNITIAADGTGRLESMSERITFGEGANAVLRPEGTALVVHGAADDFKTDPTGNSGARIACGVIRKK